jgi:hypothetical protein
MDLGKGNIKGTVLPYLSILIVFKLPIPIQPCMTGEQAVLKGQRSWNHLLYHQLSTEQNDSYIF